MFCVQYPCDQRWLVVLHGKTIGINLEGDDSTLDTCFTPFSTQMPNINGEEEVDEIHANRNDHDEGELINNI